jgi:hypothetical protein
MRQKAKRSHERSVKSPLSDKPLPIEPLVLRPEHAAKALQISRRTLWAWIRSGRVEVARPSPGVTLVLMASIRKLLELPSPSE